MQPLHLALSARRRSLCQRALIAVNAGLALGFAAVGLQRLVTPDAVTATDFTVFWTGWSLILHGPVSGLYDEAAQRATQQWLMGGRFFEGGLMSFLNPPHAALAGVPIGWLADRLGEQAAFAIWTGANLAVLCMLVRSLCDEWGASPRQHQWMLTSALLAFYPVFCALSVGQTSILLALAVLGVYRAAKASSPWTGGAWLLILSIKPQLLPMVVLYLAARRCWRLLGYASGMLAVTAGMTALALGPTIWLDYVRHLGTLEHFWGTGTPVYMLNVRGMLTRTIGSSSHAGIDAVSYAIWLAALVLVGLVLVRRRIDERHDARPAYAFAIAVALLSNPHLFMHDAVIWTVPLVLYAAALRDARGEWRPFVQFALLWPLLFGAAGLLDVNSGRLTWFDPLMWTLIATTAIIGSRWPQAGTRGALSASSPIGRVVRAGEPPAAVGMYAP
jgi:glycosyl transferase family 87